MPQANPEVKQVNVPKLERVSAANYPSFKKAAAAFPGDRSDAKLLASKGVAKAKVIARRDGTYDLVLYKKIVTKDEVVEAVKAAKKAKKAEVEKEPAAG